MTFLKRQKNFLPWGFVIGIIVALGGCSDDNMARAGGTVKCDGRTLSGGKIIFAPVGGGKPAVGVIRPDGTFNLTTGHNDGAMVGTYYVTVSHKTAEGNNEKSIRYIGPRDKPVEVVANKENDFIVDINRKNGWRGVLDD